MRRVPGHEFTGVVASLGKGVTTDSLRRPLKEGDRVAFPFFNPCNRCYWCVRGEHHVCPHRQRRSMQFTLNEYPYCDGGYAGVLLPAARPLRLQGAGHPAGRRDSAGELRDVSGAARARVLQHAVRRRRRDPGRRRPRIYAAAIAAEKGASKVISIDKQPLRLDFAKKCGATDVIDMNELPTPEARVQRVKDLTDGRGADVVVEVVGIAAATVEGLDMVRLGGKFVDIGNIVPQPVSFPAIKVIAQQVKWTGLMHYNPWIMPAALEFLVRTRDKYPLSKVVSHSFPLAEVNKAFAFAEWQGKNAGTAATRVILKP
jgi:threonine dehydrogenase-like Zn-dependent dehydrogenase